MITLHGKTFLPYLSAERIKDRVMEMAAEINQDYQGKQPLFIAVLNGAFIFASDLFRQIHLDAEISFIKLASYEGASSSGRVITAIGLEEAISGRDIILLEDIIDSGKTFHDFLPHLQERQPASIKIAALLTKPGALKYPVHVNYTGFQIPDEFVVGYGLDYDGLGRNLPGIYQLKAMA